MNKNRLLIIIIILIIICPFSILAISAQCDYRALFTEEDKDAQKAVEADIKRKEESREEELPVEVTPEEKLVSKKEQVDIKEETDYKKITEEYEIAFGIDYTNPDKYLIQGQQSQIPDFIPLEILCSNTKGLAHLEKIYNWIKDEFISFSAGGKTIGTVTAGKLLEKKSLGGCHDYALVYTAVAREIGYPAVMVRTSSIVWIERFKVDEEQARPRIGHVFVEIYLNGKWWLIDPTNGWYLDEGYDPTNPVIPLRGNIAGQNEEKYGFYVEKKGFDIWDMGIHGQVESGRLMDELAQSLDLDNIKYTHYNFKRFSR